MNLEPFFALCSNVKETERRWALAFCDSIKDLFGGAESENPAFANIDTVCSLFYGKGNRLSKSQFYRKRKYVVSLYTWLHQEGYVSEQFLEEVKQLKLDDVVSEDELATYYFGTLDSVLAYITEIGLRHCLGSENDLLPVKSAVILAWYQITPAEMTELHKSDINLDDNLVTIRAGRTSRRRSIKMEERHIRVLKLFADAEFYTSFPGCSQSVYQSSRYLVRSNRSTQLTEDNIKCWIKRFNAEVDGGQILSLVAISKCGLFSQVMDRTNEGATVAATVRSISGCDRQVAFGYAKIYARWKQRFYTKEVK